MLRIRPAPAPRTEARLRTKRPPMAYIELLSASEEDFRETVAEVEADPLFGELHSLGVVRRRGGRGRMPTEAYEERLDAEVAEFVAEHGIAKTPDGLEKLRDALETHGAQAVARKLKAPIAQVRRIHRFLTEAPAAEEGVTRRGTAEVGPDLDDFVTAGPSIDISEAVATVRDFVTRYSLAEHQLVSDFLHTEDTPDVLARRYHTTPEVIACVMQAVDFVLTTDIVSPPSAAAPARTRSRQGRESVNIVGRVVLVDGEPQLNFGEDTGYGLRYVIDGEALEALEGAEDRERVEELIAVLRHVNQRRSVQCRLVAALFGLQRDYFASGDEMALKPVSQADLARELKEHQSTISRAVRGRYIDTPYGTHELQFYCQRKKDVVLRLSAAHSELSDRELQELLKERHGCDIARRTVAYHRRAHRK